MSKRFTVAVGNNGETRTISLLLDDETSLALEQVSNQELTQFYILEEYRSRLIDRRETRRHQSFEATTESGLEFADARADIIALHEQSEQAKRLHNALQTLTGRQRAVFVAHALDGRTFREIGEKLGSTKQSVCECYYSAVKKLKKFLKTP